MDFVCIGKIVKPQGIKGEVKIQLEFDCPAVFHVKCPFYVDKVETKTASRSYRQGAGYVVFDGVNDRNEAEKLRGKKVYITIEDFDKFCDEFLVDDLVGCAIYDEKGELAGQILGVTDYGFDDILIVKCESRTYEVPFRKEIFTVEKNGRDLAVSCIRMEFEGAKVDREEM